MTDILHALENTIKDRRSMDPTLSYVAKLSAAGRGKIAQKVGEEAVETVIAAMTGNAADVTCEAADLVFHLMVLLADMGVALDDVLAELARREGVSGIAEKAARQQ